jgi:hypothetical protein
MLTEKIVLLQVIIQQDADIKFMILDLFNDDFVVLHIA